MEPVTTSVYPTGGAAYGSPAQSPTISMGDWLITYLISFVPVLGFIMLLVWAFSSSTPPSKANWAKAALVVTVLLTVVGFLFAGSIMALLVSAGSQSKY